MTTPNESVLHFANHMDTAHLPPPTAEDYQRLDAALDKIFKPKEQVEMSTPETVVETTVPETNLEAKNWVADVTMDTEQNITVTTRKEAPVEDEELVETSAKAADALLQADGWTILRQLYVSLAQSIQATSIVVLPAVGTIAGITEKVTDPAGFKQALETVQNDIREIIKGMALLISQHQDKTGIPTEADKATIAALALGYSKLQFQMDRAVQPLLLKLVEDMQEAGVDTLKFLEGAE